MECLGFILILKEKALMIELEIFRRNLKNIREAVNLSQAELARRCGITSVTLISLENGKNKEPKLSTAIKIANALGMKIDSFVSKEEWTDKEKSRIPNIVRMAELDRFEDLNKEEQELIINLIKCLRKYAQ